jgi:hypothetical protein
LATAVARLARQKLSEIFPGIEIEIGVGEERDGGEEKKMELSSAAVAAAEASRGGGGKGGGRGRGGSRGGGKSGGGGGKSGGGGDDSATMTFKERRVAAEEKRKKNAGVSGIQLVLRTSTGGFITGDSLVVEAGKTGHVEISAGEVAGRAVERLREAWEEGRGSVDEYLMDQLVIFMALARGKSKILCPAPTKISSLHLETAIYFSELLCGVKFRIEEVGDGTRIIECDGMGFGVKD